MVLSAAPLAADSQTAARVDQNQQVAAEFLKSVREYVLIHQKVEATMPDRARNTTPASIDAHERALTRLIAKARSRAVQGDIFSKAARALFRQQIARALSGPGGAGTRKSILDDNPGVVRLQVNARYPDGLPLSTMPPQLLATLPELPSELEYRFVGRRLVLLDIHAQLVVDYIDDAIAR
jgi:hypothetical protein